MPKKKKQGPTHRTKDPKQRINQELREFKTKIKRWVDGTKLDWTGKPFVTGSIYRFVLDKRLVQFVMTLAARAEKSEAAQAQASTLKMAESIRLANLPDPEDGVLSEPNPESEAAFEKYLTDSDAEGIIESDGEETETEAEASKDPTGSPDCPSGDAGSLGALGPIDPAEGDA